MFAFIKISGYLRTSKLKIVKEEYGIIRLRCCSIKNQQSTKWRIWKWFYSNWKNPTIERQKMSLRKKFKFLSTVRMCYVNSWNISRLFFPFNNLLVGIISIYTTFSFNFPVAIQIECSQFSLKAKNNCWIY